MHSMVLWYTLQPVPGKENLQALSSGVLSSGGALSSISLATERAPP